VGLKGHRAPLHTYYVAHRKSLSFKVDVWDCSSYFEQELPGSGGLVSILGDPPANQANNN